MEFIFDTNVYRNLVYGIPINDVPTLAERLRAKESALGHSAAASTIVIMELIQHLLEGDPANEECWKALNLLFLHASHIDDDEKMRKGFFYPPIEVILAQIFFGENSPFFDLYNKVIGLFLELCQNPHDDLRAKYANDIALVQKQITYIKDQVRLNVEEMLKTMNDGKLDWAFMQHNEKERKRFFERIENGEMKTLLAIALMKRAHQVMEYEDFQEAAEEKFEKFMVDYDAALIMNLNLLKSVGHGVDNLKNVTDKRWNTLTDVQIMFATLFVKDGREPKALVTEEKMIKASAEEAGVAEKVITMQQYKDMIGF